MAICPKCGVARNDGAECATCGVVLARHGSSPARARPKPPPIGVWEALTSIYKVLRWFVLAGAVLVLGLILWPDEAPVVERDDDALARVHSKIAALSGDVGRSELQELRELRLNEAELNTWMSSNLNLAPPPGQTETTEPTIEDVQSNVRDVKVKLSGDRLKGFVLFNLYGKDMSLTLEGRLTLRDGYLRLEPNAMKLGSLPIPKATIERAVSRLFDAPDNREQFRVPPHIRDIRVEGGALVVQY